MNAQMKQRIIGVVIAVIFLAIAIPFLLSGTKNKQNTAQTEKLRSSQEQVTKTANAQNAKTSPKHLSEEATPPQAASEPVASEEQIALPPENAALTNTDGNSDLAAKLTEVASKDTSKDNSSTNAATSSIAAATTKATAETKDAPNATAVNTPSQNPALHTALTQKNAVMVDVNSHKKREKIANSSTVTADNNANSTTSNVANTTLKTTAATTTKSAETEKSIATMTKAEAKSETKPKGKSEVKSMTKSQSWIVLAGVYTDSRLAHNLMRKLEIKHYHSTMQAVSTRHGVLYRVVVGTMKNKQDATITAKNISKITGKIAKVLPTTATTTNTKKIPSSMHAANTNHHYRHHHNTAAQNKSPL